MLYGPLRNTLTSESRSSRPLFWLLVTAMLVCFGYMSGNWLDTSGSSLTRLSSSVGQPDLDPMWQPDASPVGLEDRGLYRGRLIRDLWNLKLPEHSWLSGSDQCSQLVTRFTRDNTTEAVQLASYPRSGNTWTRFLLEAATGIFTTSSSPGCKNWWRIISRPRLSSEEVWKVILGRKDKWTELMRYGYLGESVPWIQGSTLVTKTHSEAEPWHWAQRKCSRRWHLFRPGASRRAILLIRDPFKAIVSLRLFGGTKSLLNSGKNVTHLFRGDDWLRQATFQSYHWHQLTASWLDFTNETLVVPYESLVRDTAVELVRMLDFLRVVPDRRRLTCLRSQLEGPAHNRQHGTVPDREVFPLPLRAQIWAEVHQLDQELRQRGHRQLPLHHYSFADEFLNIQ